MAARKAVQVEVIVPFEKDERVYTLAEPATFSESVAKVLVAAGFVKRL